MKFASWTLVGLLLSSGFARAVEIINDNPDAHCEIVELYQELPLYRDPSLFLPQLDEQMRDHKRRREPRRIDDIVRARLKGRVPIYRIGKKPHELGNFGGITRLYEAADPRLKKRAGSPAALVRDIQVCGGAENNALGFVVEQDLQEAQIYRQKEATLPPSVHEIPPYRDTPSDTTR